MNHRNARAGLRTSELGNALASLFRALPGTRRRTFWLIIAMTGTAALELLVVGATLQFLAGAVGTNKAPLGTMLPTLAATISPQRQILFSAAFLLVSVMVAAAGRLIMLHRLHRVALELGHGMATKIFHKIVHQPYSHFVANNPADLATGVERVHQVVNGVLLPVLNGLAAGLIAVAILGFLFVVSPIGAAIATLLFGITYGAVGLVTRRTLERISAVSAGSAKQRAKIVQEALGGIRDVLLDQSQPFFEERFRVADERNRHGQAASTLIAAVPRAVVEMVGAAVVCGFAAIYAMRSDGLVHAIPLLGTFAIAAQRLLPLVQQSFAGWTMFAAGQHHLAFVVALMEAPSIPPAPANNLVLPPFAKQIEFIGVFLDYPDRRRALHDLRLTIKRGDRIGIVGETGSGKSSFLDLLMGLLDPSAGMIIIDGHLIDDDNRRAWQRQIAHVPQSVYLADASIADNITLMDHDVDVAQLRIATRLAELDPWITELPEGLNTMVGERGARLSGGQRQRVAIARALYRRPQVLILDEATSALDSETQSRVLENLETLGRDITVIIVTHSPLMVAGCDVVFSMANGNLSQMAQQRS